MTSERYLLDTNILLNLLKNSQGAAAEKVRSVGGDAIFISIIVASELQFGLCKKASAPLRQRVESLLDIIPILDFKPLADVHYGENRHFL